MIKEKIASWWWNAKYAFSQFWKATKVTFKKICTKRFWDNLWHTVSWSRNRFQSFNYSDNKVKTSQYKSQPHQFTGGTDANVYYDPMLDETTADMVKEAKTNFKPDIDEQTVEIRTQVTTDALNRVQRIEPTRSKAETLAKLRELKTEFGVSDRRKPNSTHRTAKTNLGEHLKLQNEAFKLSQKYQAEELPLFRDWQRQIAQLKLQPIFTHQAHTELANNQRRFRFLLSNPDLSNYEAWKGNVRREWPNYLANQQKVIDKFKGISNKLTIKPFQPIAPR